jgi:hypothetical protein
MPAGLEVAEIFRRHGEAYRQAQAGHLGRVERRVMGAIEACRTAALGGHVERCADCGLVRIAYNSCRNRHCPKCQSLARAEWLAERQAELLPVPYFHVVFTVPAAVAEIAFQNKAVVYAILFRAAAQTLCTIAADPRHLGAEIGVVAVLHTWGQNLHHHPHVHCVVPGGGLSPDGTRWIACRPGFFLPVRVLSRLFRRLFLEQLRLVRLEQGQVSFRWRDYRHHDKAKVMTLAANEFIRRFLLHTLPDGFHRIRHYGFLANGHRRAKLAHCRQLLVAPPPAPPPPADYRQRYRQLTGVSLDTCPCCGGAMLPLGPLPLPGRQNTPNGFDSS